MWHVPGGSIDYRVGLVCRTTFLQLNLDVGFRAPVISYSIEYKKQISVLLTSELNSSQLGHIHYYNFSDLRVADGAR